LARGAIEVLRPDRQSFRPPLFITEAQTRALLRERAVYPACHGDFGQVVARLGRSALFQELHRSEPRDRFPTADDDRTTRQTRQLVEHRWAAGEAHHWSQQSGYGTGWDEPPEA
jgi:hypothetical protein